MSSSDSELEDEFLDQQIALQTAALKTLLEEVDSLLHILHTLQEILDIHYILQGNIQSWELNTSGSHSIIDGNSVSVYKAMFEAIKSDRDTRSKS